MTMKRVLLSALLSTAAPMSGDAIAAAQERPAPLVIQAQGSNFPFPEGNMPPALPSGIDTLEGVPVPLDEFMTFTQIPIVMYYGDVIPEKSSEFPGPDHWRTRLGRSGQPQGRRRHRGAFARNRHQGQYAFPLLRSEQHRTSRSPVRVTSRKGAGRMSGVTRRV